MPSFDIVSRTDLAEVDNAIQGAMREIGTRFDFKGSHCTLERAGENITIHADDDMKLRQMQELLRVYSGTTQGRDRCLRVSENRVRIRQHSAPERPDQAGRRARIGAEDSQSNQSGQA